MPAGYRAAGGAWDEVAGPDGEVRPHWAAVVRAVEHLGLAELERRRIESHRLLRDEGVTYTVHDGGEGRAATWPLDPIPFVVPGDEWAVIEAGVAQRARLLDLVLRDLYGERRLIRSGVVPPEVVYAHRGYLRAASGLPLPGDHDLVIYAADVVRDAEGNWWALHDYTQAPSGAGFAVANRRVLSRVLPGLYRESGAQRLAPFFRVLRETLAAVAPPGVDEPTVAVLTPGPLSETYYEHVLLSRRLGYPLVESVDLEVRDGRVRLRGGRGGPIDVLLRRVDAWYCDPLAFNPASRLGVPGLVDVARRGRVSIVNGVGAGMLENPGLQPFLPAACRALLDEDLLLPAPPTWWCGEPEGRAFVLEHLDELVVAPVTPRPDRAALVVADLDAAARDDLRRRIDAQPAGYVGRRRTSFSAVPCLTDGRLTAGHVALRSFAVASGETYQVLPGGLTRVARVADDLHLSIQRGGSTKDTWIVTGQDEPTGAHWLQTEGPVMVLDPGDVLAPRVAENLLWLGRYAERAECTARLVRMLLDRRNEFAGGHSRAGTRCVADAAAALQRVTGVATMTLPPTDPAVEWLAVAAWVDTQVAAVLCDPARPGTLPFALRHLLDSATAVRDQLSSDASPALSTLDGVLSRLGTGSEGGAVGPGTPQVIGTVLGGLLTLAGMTMESMVRDPGWHLLDAGRRLERAVQLVDLLDALVVATHSRAAESLVLESLLLATDSIITYRRRYRSRARLATVLDLLLLDVHNPRSLAFQMDRLVEDLAVAPDPAAPRSVDPADGSPVARAAALRAQVHAVDTAALARVAPGEDRRAVLGTYLGAVRGELWALTDAVAARHFDQRGGERSVVAGQPAWLGDAIGAALP
jgi:uncharacterized circularly permuted ATP-grasp superfamily protein/uncharacterized alpha-E superfamily protein